MGDIAIVTGAASGIGARCVERLSEAGIDVVGIDLAAPTASASSQVEWIEGDVTTDDAWHRATDAALDRFGASPSMLVLNAAHMEVGNVLELDDRQWARVFDVNVFSAVRGLRACLPAMIERRSGAIVTVASVDALFAEQGLAAYCSSKGALLQLTRTVAVDFARDGVRANCVCPGVTDTPFFRRHLSTASRPQEFLRVREERNPLGRLLDPDEVATLIAFLLSAAAKGITGSTFTVDAGLTASFDFRTGQEGA